jgi:hypothetical protein
MSKFKRVGLSFLLGLIAAAAMAVPAQGAGGVKAVCVIEGTAGVTDKAEKNVAKPSLPGTTGDRKGVRLSGGHGSYDFDSLNIVCVGTAKGEPAIHILVVNSKGWFDNVVCGTGVAFSHKFKDQKPWGGGFFHGTTLKSEGTSKLVGVHDFDYFNDLVKSLEYKVEFVGGMGHIHFNNDPNEVVKTIPKINVLPEQQKAPGKPSQPLFLAGWIGLGFSLEGPDVLNNKAAKDPTDLTKYNCVNSFSVLGVVLIDKTPK